MSNRLPDLLRRARPAAALFALWGLGSALLAACAGNDRETYRHGAGLDLDSLHRVNVHNDSIESNLAFYEEAYEDYHARFPGVDKPAYMRIAKGKDQEFCLFKPNPSRICLDVADKFNDLNLKQSAKDAYEAGLLSEGYNESPTNVRLWGSLGQIAVEEEDYASGKAYLMKVLEVEPKNKWAKKLLASIPR